MKELIIKIGIIALNAIINAIPMLLGAGFAMKWDGFILTVLWIGMIIIDVGLYALFKEKMEDK